MAQEIEVQQIMDHIGRGENFLLSGGAGSGKTYSLSAVIKEVIEKYPYSAIGCMTYTNAAVAEIKVEHSNLSVTTIHDFLWDVISPYQKDLKQALIAVINSADYKTKNPESTPLSSDYFDELEHPIRYRQNNRIKDGIISHDTVIEVAEYLFSVHTKLCDILKDKYKFIFVDEYQDTHPRVIKILLSHLKRSSKQNIIGLFGDSMQAIYDTGVGDVETFIKEKDIFEVQKVQNRRNPKMVIDLANELRTDHLKQEPSKDKNAPNMFEGVVKMGIAKFIYSDSNDLDYIKERTGWNFSNVKETKELNLTHNLIAEKAGFGRLMEIYDDDPVFKLKEEAKKLIKSSLVSDTPFEFTDEETFDEVLDRLKPCEKDGTLKKEMLQSTHPDFYGMAKDIPFAELSKLYLDKDSLIDDKKDAAEDENKTGSKRDALTRHLMRLCSNIKLYQEEKYNEFIRTTHFRIQRLSDKRKLKEVIETLVNSKDLTIGEAIDFAETNNICYKDDALIKYITGNNYLYKRVRELAFREFMFLYDYLEGHTPFSTQHKIKGAQFDNVLVIMDNGGWNKYNFEYLLNPGIFKTLTKAKQASHPTILKRTQKIFYVCCTRAKENLFVFYHSPSPDVIRQATVLFKGNVEEI